MERHVRQWPLSVMCQVLEVSRSGYYAWIERPPSKRQERAMKLTEQIRAACSGDKFISVR